MHLRVPVRSLQSVLATARVRAKERKSSETVWECWRFLEDHLNDEAYIDLDDVDGKEIPHIGDIGDMVDYEIYFEEMQRGAGIPSEGMVQLDIPFVDTTEDEKESAGSWIKHNI